MEELDLSPLSDSPRYVTPSRLAELIGLAEYQERVQAWIDDGTLPVIWLAGHVLVDLQKLRSLAGKERP